MREAGLEVATDGAGNLFGRLRGRRPELPEVWTGSHLDSVPDGGRFDGALGGVGGLEAMSAIEQQERTRTGVAFRGEGGGSAPDEEGLEQIASVVPAGLSRTRAVAMDEGPSGALREGLQERGLAVVELPSGAGHDAGVLAAAGVPTGMLFVRSLNGGVSHAPEEHSDEADIEQGVAVLAGALRRLASAVD